MRNFSWRRQSLASLACLDGEPFLRPKYRLLCATANFPLRTKRDKVRRERANKEKHVKRLM